jgi:hypothetical protein
LLANPFQTISINVPKRHFERHERNSFLPLFCSETAPNLYRSMETADLFAVTCNDQ